MIETVEPGAVADGACERAPLAMAGLPNVHSHAFQRGMAGLSEYRSSDRDTFWSWREIMYRFLAHLTPDDVEAIAAQAYVEMLESGFTRAGEFHYLHHDPSGAPYAAPAEMSARLIAAAESSGIALTLLPVFYAHGGFGGAAPAAGQRRFLNDLDRFVRVFEASERLVASVPRARIGVAPHSLRAVTPDELRALVALAGARPIHIHAAEQLREVEECVAWCGQRPVEWLLEHQPVDARYCIVHATHVTPAEVERLAQSGAVAGLCPVTEANLGDGTFPAAEYLAAGGSLALGTDSNVLIDAAAELRALEYSQRLSRRARNLLAAPPESTGRRMFSAAVSGGARALDVSAAIEVGAPADLVSLDLEAPVFAARTGDRWLDSWIFAGGRHCIDGVWSGGVKRVSNGRHHARGPIAARFRSVLERLLGT